MFDRVKVPALVALMMAFGCGEVGDESDARELEGITSALSPCDEMVPANRYIDGIPAYAQCPTVESGAVYSNNGVDTSTTKMGSDWVRTQYSGGYQCTELAHRYWHFVWGVPWIPNGNAGQWCDTPPPASSGVVQSTTPVHGDLIVFAPGSCGAAQGTGHVAVVDTVDMAAGKVSVVEQNRARRGSYMISCGKCFLHVAANDGTKQPKVPGASSDGGVAAPPVGDPRPPARDAALPGPGPRDAAAAWPLPQRDAAVASSDAGVRADAATAARDAAPPPDGDDDGEDEGGEDEGGNENADDEETDDADEESASADDDAKSSEGCSLTSSRSTSEPGWWLLAAFALVTFRRRTR